MNKEFNDQVLDSVFRSIVESGTKDLETHFVYAGNEDVVLHGELANMSLNGLCIDEDSGFEYFGEQPVGIFFSNDYNHTIKAVFVRNFRLDSCIEEKMKKYQIMAANMTTVNMQRLELMTKKEIDQTEPSVNEMFGWIKLSVNDDLELFFEKLQRDTEYHELVVANFSPKLTEEEMNLVEQKDSNYMATLKNPKHVDDIEIFVRGLYSRSTFLIRIKP